MLALGVHVASHLGRWIEDLAPPSSCAQLTHIRKSSGVADIITIAEPEGACWESMLLPPQPLLRLRVMQQ